MTDYYLRKRRKQKLQEMKERLAARVGVPGQDSRPDNFISSFQCIPAKLPKLSFVSNF